MHEPTAEDHQRHHKTHRLSMSLKSSSWFSLPAPIRRIFETFPLVTYEENRLPQRSPHHSQHTLYIFTTDGESLSPNPACLKWQAYLLIKKIRFRTASANNHASPTGSLPFILPAPGKVIPQPIPASKIPRWIEDQDQQDIRLDAYMALIDQNIRNAWLYYLYLTKNFPIASRLYVETASSSSLVRLALARQLQAAAKDQLLKTRQHIDQEEMYDYADAAFRALQTLLGDHSWFSRNDTPGLFDATLFSYTHLILKFADQWYDRRLLDSLQRYPDLVRHRDNMLHNLENL